MSYSITITCETPLELREWADKLARLSGQEVASKLATPVKPETQVSAPAPVKRGPGRPPKAPAAPAATLSPDEAKAAYQQVQDRINTIIDLQNAVEPKTGTNRARGIIAQFGVSKSRELTPDLYPAVIEALDADIAALKAGDETAEEESV